MNIARLALAPFLLALVACSSSSDPGSSSGTPQDPGLQGDGNASTAPDTNPDGVAYPTDNLGTVARSETRAGNRIRNYKFVGYFEANRADGLKPISLAQFYDPTGKKYKLIHLVAAASWCPPCQGEAKMVAPLKDQFVEKGIVWLVSLVEGPARGTGSVQRDLDNWMDEYKGPFTHWLDPSNKNLGPFYDIAAIPWNANINAQTMEILSAKTGAPRDEGELWADLDGWLGKINSGELK